MAKRTRLGFAVTALTLILLGPTGATAYAADAPYPSRPIRIVVPFAPGGGIDSVARILSPKLGESTGQTWVVDNRPGAAGNVGAEIVAKASADGYTLLAALNTQLTANPSLYKLAFDVEKDLAPVTMVCIAEHIVVINPGVPAKTLKELLAFAKQKPNALNFASAGVGSSLHLAAELLKRRAGIEMLHVPYKGAGPAVASMLAGETQVLTGTVASTVQHIKAGKLRALASTGAQRSKVFPELPTVAESGFPGFDADAWYPIMAPGGTPRPIIERINLEMIKAIQHPDSQAAMLRLGLNPVTSTPAELAKRVRAEATLYATVIKEAGIRAE